MRRVISLAIAISMVVVLGQIGLASSFKILGTRPLGMGGAFVAVAEDSIAQYWNPAGFALQKGFDLQIPVSLGIETTEGLIDTVDNIQEITEAIENIQQEQESGTLDAQSLEDFMEVMNYLNNLGKEDIGLGLDLTAGLGFRLRNLGIGIFNLTEMGAHPYLDLQNISLGDFDSEALDDLDDIDPDGNGFFGVDPGELTEDQEGIADDIADILTDLGVTPDGATNEELAEELVYAASEAGLTDEQISEVVSIITEIAGELAKYGGTGSGSGFSNNESKVTINGFSVFELMFTYAHAVPIIPRLYAGGNFKIMRGYVGFFEYELFEEDQGGLEESLWKNYNEYLEESTTVGIDVGVLFDVKKELGLRGGMLIRNLNYPSFKQPPEAKAAGFGNYVVQPQVRVGVAYWPLNFITLAADLDLTNNKTVLQGYYSRMLSLGAEVNIFNRSWLNFALRGGFMDNLAESSGSMFTAGLGLNIFHFQLDFAGAMSTKSTTIADSQKFPTALTGSLGISINF